jgi:hypothetical protein
LALPLILAAVSGCSLTAPSPPGVAPPPTIPEIMQIGTVAEIRIADPHRVYVLEDGREIEISTDTTRVLFEGGLGQPLVHGRDIGGDFLAVFTAQGGLPADCHLPGIGHTGTDRGAYIEIAGVLWPKASTFHSTEISAIGRPYAGSTRFCFNEQAEVAYAVP